MKTNHYPYPSSRTNRRNLIAAALGLIWLTGVSGVEGQSPGFILVKPTPGGIDPHVHMAHPWILPGGKILTTKGPDHVGMAALYGGTTTLLDFVYWLVQLNVFLKSYRNIQMWKTKLNFFGFL